MTFDPNKHLMKLKGKDYLPVAARLTWFRDEWPCGMIETEALILTDDKAVFRATVRKVDADGVVKGTATGTKSETPKGFADFIEKAETGSIGRALAALGFGTQFAPEFDEGERIVDTPQQPRTRPQPAPPSEDSVAAMREIHAVAKNAGVSHDMLHQWAVQAVKVDSLKDVSVRMLKGLAAKLQDPDTIEKFIAKYAPAGESGEQSEYLDVNDPARSKVATMPGMFA